MRVLYKGTNPTTHHYNLLSPTGFNIIKVHQNELLVHVHLLSWQVLLGLNELRKEGHFCDVTLSVDGVKFPAHRNVLASLSPYFKVSFFLIF